MTWLQRRPSRRVAISVCVVFAILVVGLGSLRVGAQRSGVVIRHRATNEAVDYSVAALMREFQAMDAENLATLRLVEGGTYNVNIRRLHGAETALTHAKTVDVWVVQDGEGVLVTGGQLLDPSPGTAPGDLRGSGIRGGKERTIRTGDVVFIPAGVPHGVRESTSITWLNIRFDIN